MLRKNNLKISPAKIGPAPTAIIVVVSKGCELDVVPSVTLGNDINLFEEEQ